MDPEPTKEFVEDNAGVVNSIILWRIYDILLLLLMESNPDAARKLSAMHEEGHFLGPNPSYKEPENE